MQIDSAVQNFFQVIASTRPTSRLRNNPAEFTSIQSQALNATETETSESEDSDSPPTSQGNSSSLSQSSSEKIQLSTEWMFEGKLYFDYDDRSFTKVE